MAETEEKTESATPRRRTETREKGQVAQSRELGTSALLFAALGAIVFGGGAIASRMAGSIRSSLDVLALQGRAELDVSGAAGLLSGVLEVAARSALPILAALVVAGALAGYGQVGFLVAPKALGLDLSRVDPIKGLRRVFGLRGLMRALLALCRMAFIAGTMAVAAWSDFERILALSGADLGPLLAGIGRILLKSVTAALLAVLVLALVDWIYQRYQHEKDLRMSKQEVKEEIKSTEGDPRVKARVREIQRHLAQQRMMSAVPEATVVVTNPTHFAVALRYERAQPGESAPGAPRCVAKGADHLALRIREVAREAGVLVYEDPPLARSLYARVEVGDEIPVELYEAVAQVLAYVYRVQGLEARA